MKKFTPILLIVALTILITSCKPSGTSPTSSPMETVSGQEEPVVEATNTIQPVLSQNLLPPEPQELSFQTPQGRTLQGRYFPAAVEDAPLVILIHWVMANQNDWKVIGTWLQNRGQTLPTECVGMGPVECTWQDSTWFPSMDNRSYAVFTFSLSGCEQKDGCHQWTGPAWAEDANAGIKYASQLEGSIPPISSLPVPASVLMLPLIPAPG